MYLSFSCFQLRSFCQDEDRPWLQEHRPDLPAADASEVHDRPVAQGEAHNSLKRFRV